MPKIYSLQLLRAFAAIIVLIGHCMAEAQHFFDTDMPLLALPWTRGVDIFFVLSGFIITLSAQRFARQPLAFIWRRFWRVAPLYYFFTTLMVVILIALPSGLKDTVLDPWQIASSYGFYPYARADGRIAPVLSLGWTLNYEMLFYLIFTLGLALTRPIWISAIFMGSFCLLGWIFPFQSTLWLFLSNPIVLEFLFGIFIAQIYLNTSISTNFRYGAVLFLSGLSLFIALHFSSWPRFIAAGIPAGIMLSAGCFFAPSFGARFQIWGDSSYALYLSHRFGLRGASILLAPLLIDVKFGAAIYVIGSCGICLFLGLLVHLYIERPMAKPPTIRVFA